jgi:cell division protein FtsW (lipid II flippase)
METHNTRLKNRRAVGVACACAATGLGLLYMAAAGAPTIYLAVNVLSLVMGLALFAVLPPTGLAPRVSGGVLIVLGGLLLATALFGVSVDGAARWIRVTGLSLQTSLIVLPPMLVAFARGRGLLATIGMILAAVALALQPDRAMAGALAAALAVLAIYRPDRWVVSTLAVAVAGFAITLTRPDSLPAVPYVDQILYTSFQLHLLAGLAVVGGALLLIVPAIAGQWIDPKNREVHAVFGTMWLSVMAAAALGNYPTPLVGYGGSAILGYALSLSFMPSKLPLAAVALERAKDSAPTDIAGHTNLRIAVEY